MNRFPLISQDTSRNQMIDSVGVNGQTWIIIKVKEKWETYDGNFMSVDVFFDNDASSSSVRRQRFSQWGQRWTSADFDDRKWLWRIDETSQRSQRSSRPTQTSIVCCNVTRQWSISSPTNKLYIKTTLCIFFSIFNDHLFTSLECSNGLFLTQVWFSIQRSLFMNIFF